MTLSLLTLLDDPADRLLLTMAGVTALAIAATLLPLRSGGGQHAHAGPGTLTVRQLTTIPNPKRSERNFHPVYANESSVHSPPNPGLDHIDLCWLPSDEPDYVGRHRLVTQ